MLSRKHYEAIAATIKDRLDREADAADRAAKMYGDQDRSAREFRANLGGVQLLACDLIDLLQRDNPRFDAERFARAAGLAHLIDVHPRWKQERV